MSEYVANRSAGNRGEAIRKKEWNSCEAFLFWKLWTLKQRDGISVTTILKKKHDFQKL